MISFFDIGRLFLVSAAVLEVKQNFHHCPAENILELNICLVWLFGGHLNNASEPYFPMGPSLRTLNDDCSDG